MPDVYTKYENLKKRYLQDINALGDALIRLSDAELREKNLHLKSEVRSLLTERYRQMKDPGRDLLLESKDLLLKVLPRAYALAREATQRLAGMRHYDEQIIGGIALHLGNIAEMKNGEGKTIVALLPAYLNALFTSAEYDVRRPVQVDFIKRNVHIVTTNDYLARRDYIWLRPVYEFLGVSVGYLQEIFAKNSSYSMSQFERKTMYSADIVYGATQEFIFDYLRDNSQPEKRFQVQSGRYFAIIDEVDHVLLDEARTPHILSDVKPNLTRQDLELVYLVNNLARRIYADQDIFALVNTQSLSLTSTGADIIRILGTRIIIDRVLRREIEKFLPAEDIVSMVYELIACAAQKHPQLFTGPLAAEIQRLRQATSQSGPFFRVDPKGRFQGFSDEMKEKILFLIQNSLGGETPFDAKSFYQLFQLMVKNLPAFQEVLETYGLTPQEFSQLVNREELFQLLQDLTTNPEAGVKQLGRLMLEFLDYFVVDLVEVSLVDINRMRLFTQDSTVFLFILLNSWGDAQDHPEINTYLRKIIDVYLVDLDKSDSALGAEAFLNVITSSVFPILTNLITPVKAPRIHNKIVQAFAVIIKIIITTINIEKPRSRFEKELRDSLEKMRQTFSTKLYSYEQVGQRIRFTFWTGILIEELARQLTEYKLWEARKGKLRDDFQMDEVEHRVSFLLEQALRAYSSHQRNNQYLVQGSLNRTFDAFTQRMIDQDVVIIGELTGRIMPGRRWQQWLHSFLEAKENIPVRQEQRSIARISAQGYFKMYPKLGGMTGTAHTGLANQGLALMSQVIVKVRKMFNNKLELEALPNRVDPVLEEFRSTYKTDVVVVPEHRPRIRVDRADTVFLSREAKYKAAIDEILEIHASGQPILVETVSVAQSQEIADLLRKHARANRFSLSFQLLNALNDEQEAEIITQAGAVGAITISTQLAGRGTDIVVSEDALRLGGLYVICVERKWSRRWDDQIAGRAGRQGERGTSHFLLSYDDEILLPVKDQALGMLQKFNLLEIVKDEPLENNTFTTLFTNQQIGYEYYSGRTRQQTEGFDKILGMYRQYLYALRDDCLGDSYPCPVCKRETRRIALDSQAVACPACMEKGTHSITVGLWRPYFEKILNAVIRWSLSKSSLEEVLIEKYASHPDPAYWKLDQLAEELSKWVKAPVKKQQIATGININNTLSLQKETAKLSLNIYRILEDNRREEISNAAREIIQHSFEHKEPDPRMWDFQDLFRTLNSQLNLEIPLFVFTDLNTYKNRSEIMKRLSEIIAEAITYSISQSAGQEIKEKTIFQLVDAFNPILKEPIDSKTISRAVQENRLPELLAQRLAGKYNDLVLKFGKPALFELENSLFREVIGDMWSDVLTDSDLVMEEVWGEDLQDRLLDFKYRIARLFNQHYSEAGILFISRVLKSAKDLQAKKEHQVSQNLYVSLGDLCHCGSGKEIQVCCGERLYSYLEMVSNRE